MQRYNDIQSNIIKVLSLCDSFGQRVTRDFFELAGLQNKFATAFSFAERSQSYIVKNVSEKCEMNLVTPDKYSADGNETRLLFNPMDSIYGVASSMVNPSLYFLYQEKTPEQYETVFCVMVILCEAREVYLVNPEGADLNNKKIRMPAINASLNSTVLCLNNCSIAYPILPVVIANPSPVSAISLLVKGQTDSVVMGGLHHMDWVFVNYVVSCLDLNVQSVTQEGIRYSVISKKGIKDVSILLNCFNKDE